MNKFQYVISNWAYMCVREYIALSGVYICDHHEAQNMIFKQCSLQKCVAICGRYQ
jgi:hypothetical protein